MLQPGETSAPTALSTPRVFCRKCGYALVGLASRQCPECGRGFDLQDPRTFARRPPRGWVWRWGRRLLVLTLLLLLAAGAGIYWLWRGWQGEQKTIAQLRAQGQQFTVAPIGPDRLRWVLGARLGFLTERVDSALLHHLSAAQTEQLDLGSLTHIQKLAVLDCELSHRKLDSLAGLTRLRELSLYGLRIEKPDLAFLERLPALSTLLLQGQRVSNAALEPIGRLAHLKCLVIYDTNLTDADLQQLRGLASLEELHLDRNLISDAGLEHLQGLKSLKGLWIDQRLIDSPGMAKLKQALPGLKVMLFPQFFL